MKRALLIGSEGNIGRPLAKHLSSQGYDIYEVDIRPGHRKNYSVADINHPLDLLPAFDSRPDVVFFLSAMVSRMTCEQASSLAIATNIAGTNNVMQLCLRTNAKLVFVSSSEIYGPHCDIMDEDMVDPAPNNRYGLSKLIGEQLVEYEVRNSGLKAVVLRPFMMYDEEEKFGNHRSAMVRFAGNLALNYPIYVHKESERSWLHAKDAIRAIEASAFVDDYQVINIGHPDVTTVENLAEMIRLRLNASKELIRLTDLPERMTLKKYPLLERQREVLGIEPAISLEEGVGHVCRRISERIAAGEEWR